VLRWYHVIVLGFALFIAVTGYVASLGLTMQTVQHLSYVVATAYALGLTGMVIALAKAGVMVRLLIALLAAVGMASLALLSILPPLTSLLDVSLPW
jgi:hypothetical protein